MKIEDIRESNPERRRARLQSCQRDLPLIGKEQLESRLCLASSAEFLGDLNTTPVSVNAGQFVAADDFVYFVAHDAPHGRELWRTDGTTAGTVLVKDIYPGPASSYLSLGGSSYGYRGGYGGASANLDGNVLIFAADDGVHGREIWRSDGTSEGTFLLRDITDDSFRGGYRGYYGYGRGSGPAWLHRFGNEVFFSAGTSGLGSELWKTDGTQQGTVLVKDIAPGSASSSPIQIVDFGGNLIFAANDGQHGNELWTSDGTAEGTRLIHDNNPGGGDGVIYFCGHQSCSFPLTKHPTLDRGFFTGNDGNTTSLWVTDGTHEGTFSLGGNSNYSPNTVPLGNKVAFTSYDGNSWGIWTSDGTRDNLTLVRDFEPNDYVGSLLAADDKLYFLLSRAGRNELWQTDGTSEGTFAAISNLGGANYPQPRTVLGDTLFFTAHDGQQDRLWKSNEEGTSVVLAGYINWLAPLDDKLIFSSTNGVWSTDAAAEEVQRLFTGQLGYSQSQFVNQGNLFFAGKDGQVWTTDGTEAGTMQVSEIAIGTQDSNPNTFVSFRGKHYFLASHGSGMGLYEHDPLSGATRQVQSISYANPDTLRVYGDRLVFIRNDQLWSTDGSTSERVARITGVFEIEVVDDIIYFLSYSSSSPSLYRSDGTTEGTQRIRTLDGPRDLTIVGDQLFFSNYDSQGRDQLWTSDGTASGTKAVSKPIQNSQLLGLAPADEGLFFANRVWDQQQQTNIWHSDGSPEGTIQLTDFKGNSSYYYYQQNFPIQSLGNLAVFAADDGEHGTELWSSDGTKEGTHLIADLDNREFAAGSTPSDFVRTGNASYFIARGSDGLQSVWRVPDEDPDLVHAVAQGLRIASNLTPFGDRILFAASRDFNEPILWITNDAGDDASTELRGVNPQDITVIDKLAYFVGNGNTGSQLWITDGTRTGTRAITNNRDGGALPADLTVVGDTLYFTATTNASGRELWKTNGSNESTVMVRDINPASEGTTFSELTALGSKLLFVAESTSTGRELWISDGSEAGTQIVADLRNEITKSSFADQYAQVGAWTYFIADDGVHGRELWRTDGTAEGTSLVEDLQPGRQDRAIDDLTAVGDSLFFTASTSNQALRRLFAIADPDGMPQEIRASGSPIRGAADLTVFNDMLYFSAQVSSRGGRGLYRVDATMDGATATQLPKAGDPTEFMVVRDRLFFAADDGERGRELWQTDGTAEGTTLVLDIFDALAVASAPEQFVEVDSRVYFTAYDQSHGTELWSTDGTVAGTHMVIDISEGSSSSSPLELTEFRGELIFSAEGRSDRLGRELWITDGTPEGTRTVRRDPLVFPGNAVYASDPVSITATDDAVFFLAFPPARETEVWTSDGTHEGTTWVSSFSNDGGSIASTEELVAAGGSVYFAATNGKRGRELWTSDGTRAGTRMVRDIRPGSGSSISADVRNHKLVPHGDMLYFAADSDGNQAAEIWITDGTEEGTRILHDPRGGMVGAFPLDVADGWLYFSSIGPAGQGNELWRTDGTVENTNFVADLTLGQASTIFFPHGKFTPLRAGQFLFPAVTQREGTELWVTDGTEAGTYALDLESGPGSTMFGDLVQLQVIDEIAYFFASVPSKGTGLWKSDGTVAGTELVHSADLKPWPDLTLINDRLYFGVSDLAGSLATFHDGAVHNVALSSPVPKGSSTPAEFSAVGDRLYFVADDGAHGREIWLSDGTADGTRRVSDLLPGLNSPDPKEFTAVGQQIFFSASTPEAGRELWKITAAGDPKFLRDILAGAGDSNPSELTAWNGQLAFTVKDSAQNSVLWMSDGTEDGTRRLLDSSQSQLLRNPRIAGVHEHRLFIFAESVAAESWLWRFDSLADPPLPITRAAADATLQIISDRLHFTGFDPQTGNEPWISDGTASGSRRLADVNQNTFGSDPQSLNVLDGVAYFTADEGQGRDLWQSDGTIAGTRTVRSLIPDLPDHNGSIELVTETDGVYLTLSGDVGTELWKVEPGNAKAELWWRDTEQQQFDSSLGVSGNQWFFTVNQAATGSELWVSDGTAAGTQIVRDVNPGVGSSSIDGWTPPFKDGHLFVAENPTHGKELWFTNGTGPATYRISDIHSGPEGSRIGPIHVAGDHILFSASDGTHGSEPWISDGSTEGTRMLANIDARTRGSDPSWLTVAGDQLFFVASDEDGEYLWRWAPTMDAPEKVSVEVQRPSDLVADGNLVYFSGHHPDSGLELWASDGLAAGTRLISDVLPGPESSAPKPMYITDRGDLLFSAVDAAHGREAWWLPVLAGDTNADRDVDFDDFLTFTQHFGERGSQSEGDFDQDGIVGFFDFLLLAANFGRSG